MGGAGVAGAGSASGRAGRWPVTLCRPGGLLPRVCGEAWGEAAEPPEERPSQAPAPKVVTRAPERGTRGFAGFGSVRFWINEFWLSETGVPVTSRLSRGAGAGGARAGSVRLRCPPGAAGRPGPCGVGRAEEQVRCRGAAVPPGAESPGARRSRV